MNRRDARDSNRQRLRPQGISHLAGILSSLSSMGIYEGAEQRYEWGDIFREPPEADLRDLFPKGSLDVPVEGSYKALRKRYI